MERKGFSLADDEIWEEGQERLTDRFSVLFWGPAAFVMTSCAFPTSGVRPRSSV
jgi:hypothetical protein